MATVQVLVPCYNYGRYLEACVGSVLSQTGVGVDVLIIDDCSTDNTPDICQKMRALDPRVRFIRHESNKGHIATYNEGISLIRGDYFVLLSADDLLTPGALSRATELMEANPAVGMVYGHPISLYGETLPAARTTATNSTVWSGREWVRLVCRAGKNFVVCPEAVVRSRIQERIGGYSTALPHSADMEMWLRIAAISDIGRVNGADQAYYRVHAASMQRTIHSGFLFDLCGRRDAFQSAFDQEAGELADAESLHLDAKRALAAIALRFARKARDLETEDHEPVDDYCAFALSLDPDIVKTRLWRAFQRAGRTDRSTVSRVLAQQKARLREHIERELIARLEWRWARRTGIYLPR